VVGRKPAMPGQDILSRSFLDSSKTRFIFFRTHLMFDECLLRFLFSSVFPLLLPAGAYTELFSPWSGFSRTKTLLDRQVASS